MVNSTSPVSSEIGLISELMVERRRENGVHLEPETVTLLLKRLDILRQMAASMEHELGAYRISRAADYMAGVLGDLATEALNDGLLDAPDSNIVRPKFGGER